MNGENSCNYEANCTGLHYRGRAAFERGICRVVVEKPGGLMLQRNKFGEMVPFFAKYTPLLSGSVVGAIVWSEHEQALDFALGKKNTRLYGAMLESDWPNYMLARDERRFMTLRVEQVAKEFREAVRDGTQDFEVMRAWPHNGETRMHLVSRHASLCELLANLKMCVILQNERLKDLAAQPTSQAAVLSPAYTAPQLAGQRD